MKVEELGDFLRSVEIQEPIFIRNVILYPLKAVQAGVERDFLTLEEGNFVISELEPPRVDAVRFRNLSDKPTFIVDGEGIMGARQDRVVNTSLWLEGGKEYEIPVSCVEEKRWSGSMDFIPALALLNPSLRMILCKGVSRSLSENRGYKSDQRSLWENIERTLSTLKVSSKTRSINDAYRSLREEIESYLTEFGDLGGEISGLIVDTPALTSFDLFGSRDLLLKLWRKLLRSYLLEGFLIKGKISVSINKIRGFIGSLPLGKARVYDAPCGSGKELRFEEKGMMIGKVLFLEDGFLHLSVFKVKK